MLWTRGIDKPRMANLIATIRRDYPWLEQEHWQPELVARWEKKVEGGGVSGPNPWVWIVLVAIFFAILPSLIESDGDMPPTTDEVLQRYANIDSPEIAIGAFLENRFPGSDVDVASLRRGNPDFLQEMTNVWDIYKMEPGPFESELVELTVETYFQSLRRLPDALLVEDAAYRRTVLDKLKTDPLRCAAFLRRPRSFVVQESRSADIPQDYLNHMLQVVQGKIPAPGTGPARSGAPVSVATLAAIAADSALPPSVLRRALTGPAASDVELCTAALALYSHLPKLPETERRVLVAQMLRDRT